MPLRAAAVTFWLDPKSNPKGQVAVMQNNKRLSQVGLKLAFAMQTLKQQTSLKKKRSFV